MPDDQQVLVTHDGHRGPCRNGGGEHDVVIDVSRDLAIERRWFDVWMRRLSWSRKALPGPASRTVATSVKAKGA
jgi:hypothetical protein